MPPSLTKNTFSGRKPHRPPLLGEGEVDGGGNNDDDDDDDDDEDDDDELEDGGPGCASVSERGCATESG